MTDFQQLGLAQPILEALAQANYVTPTPIQQQAIPHIIAGRDLQGLAQTGTGKTAAFALPILNHLANNQRRASPRSCRILVLSPTRELASQILNSFDSYGRNLRLRMAIAIGGVPIGRQARAVANGVDILVATPGRLMDLVDNVGFRLNEVEILVLDEADQMLDMGFIHAIRAIAAQVPRDRQSLFFSATMPPAIADLAHQLLKNPAKVAVAQTSKTADGIDQNVIFIDRSTKGAALIDLLSDPAMNRSLVFTRTKRGADQVVRILDRAGLRSDSIHGNKSQSQRERALHAFRQGRINILVATDIAARGIDVSGVSHVFNYDLPNVPESYVHRIGRTARAGATGTAVSFCSDSEERGYLRAIERLIRMPLTVMEARASWKALPPTTESQQNKTANPSSRRPSPSNAQSRQHQRPSQDYKGERREDAYQSQNRNKTSASKQQRSHDNQWQPSFEPDDRPLNARRPSRSEPFDRRSNREDAMTTAPANGANRHFSRNAPLDRRPSREDVVAGASAKDARRPYDPRNEQRSASGFEKGPGKGKNYKGIKSHGSAQDGSRNNASNSRSYGAAEREDSFSSATRARKPNPFGYKGAAKPSHKPNQRSGSPRNQQRVRMPAE